MAGNLEREAMPILPWRQIVMKAVIVTLIEELIIQGELGTGRTPQAKDIILVVLYLSTWSRIFNFFVNH